MANAIFTLTCTLKTCIFGMNITFKDKKLGKIAHDENKLKAKYGKVHGKKIKRRIDALRIAETLEDVRYVEGNFHELIGDRKGEWACDLD